MAQRDKLFQFKVFALAGVVVVLLVVDAILLASIVRPADPSDRMAPAGVSARTTEGPELAFFWPTHDPRTPWPTRTPTPTATPWLILPTPEPSPAMPPLTGSTPLPQATLAPATLLPPVVATSPALGTTSTPTLQTAAVAAIASPTNAGLPADTPGWPTETPDVAPGETPGGDPTATPVYNPGETPLPPTPRLAPGDLPDFEAYVRGHRNTIAGQPLDIVSLTVDLTNGDVPRFVLDVAGSETSNVFAAQPAADVFDYGRSLLDDAKRYLGNDYCAVAVESTYETTNIDACSTAPEWCRLGAHDQSPNTWTVTWTYVRGSFTGGTDTVEAWNASP